MPNTTTLNETVRSPIDGTEYVRLATPGANWKARVSDILASGLIEDTAVNILMRTPTVSLMAYATDIGVMFIADGTAWNIDSSYFTLQSQSYDIGGIQLSNRIGYGKDYVTDKDLVNCTIGYGSLPGSEGQLRHDGVNHLLEVYQGGEWQLITAGVHIRDVNLQENPVSYVLEDKPLTQWIAQFSGDSELLGLNGLPAIQGYTSDLGAYPVQQQVNGGTF